MQALTRLLLILYLVPGCGGIAYEDAKSVWRTLRIQIAAVNANRSMAELQIALGGDPVDWWPVGTIDCQKSGHFVYDADKATAKFDACEIDATNLRITGSGNFPDEGVCGWRGMLAVTGEVEGDCEVTIGPDDNPVSCSHKGDVCGFAVEAFFK